MKHAPEKAREKLAFWLEMISRYMMQGAKVTPKQIEQGLDSRNEMSRQGTALLGRLFAGAEIGEEGEEELDAHFTVHENMLQLMNMFDWRVSSEPPKLSSLPTLRSEYPHVLAFLGCNLEEVKHFTTCAWLIPQLTLLPCQDVTNLLTEM